MLLSACRRAPGACDARSAARSGIGRRRHLVAWPPPARGAVDSWRTRPVESGRMLRPDLLLNGRNALLMCRRLGLMVVVGLLWGCLMAAGSGQERRRPVCRLGRRKSSARCRSFPVWRRTTAPAVAWSSPARSLSTGRPAQGASRSKPIVPRNEQVQAFSS